MPTISRPAWAETSDLMRTYYDAEWGVPVTSEQALFERLSLEAFQAGLSWNTVLNKRAALREVFCNFLPDKVAQFTEEDIERLAQDARIVRHRGKIRATITNAQATLALRVQAQAKNPTLQSSTIPRPGVVSAEPLTIEAGLPALIWSFKPENTPAPRVLTDILAQDSTSQELACALKKAGFSFIGATSAYALMSAIGMIDNHLLGSHRRGCSGLYLS